MMTRRLEEVRSPVPFNAHTIPKGIQHYIYQIASTLKPINLILAGNSPFVARRIPQRGEQSIASRRCRGASIRWVALLLWWLLRLLLLLLGLLFSSHLVHQPSADIEKHRHGQTEENKEHRLPQLIIVITSTNSAIIVIVWPKFTVPIPVVATLSGPLTKCQDKDNRTDVGY